MDALPARLTHQDAPEVTRRLAAGLASSTASSGAAWSIDAAALTHFDSSALAVLLECRRLADAKGLKVQVRGAPPKLGRLAKLYGLDDVLLLEADPTDAVQR